MNMFSKLFKKEKKLNIDFCMKNLDRFLTDENLKSYESFMSQKNIQYKEFECQSRCKECKTSPYAIVNGEFIAANDSQELLDKLRQIRDGSYAAKS
ncbi:DUF1450 domain-containing protein [Bacillus sp. PS06]|nr:DUF1450 domain-containing protein [Bacillus sp. PS06]